MTTLLSRGAVQKKTLVIIITVTVIVASVAWSIYSIMPQPEIKAPPNPALALQGQIGSKLGTLEPKLAFVRFAPSDDGKTLAITGKVPTKAVQDQLKALVDAQAAQSNPDGVTIQFNVTVEP